MWKHEIKNKNKKIASATDNGEPQFTEAKT